MLFDSVCCCLQCEVVQCGCTLCTQKFLRYFGYKTQKFCLMMCQNFIFLHVQTQNEGPDLSKCNFETAQQVHL